LNLNARAQRVVERMLDRADELNIQAHPIEKGGLFVDCGLSARGGLLAGVELARLCMSDLAEVRLIPGDVCSTPTPYVHVVTDHPVAACLASQYAGWAIQEGKFFAMGSGPMRAASGKEAIYDTIGMREDSARVVGVLETRKPPGAEVVAKVAAACRVEPGSVTLVAAPTSSLAGGVQIVARSVETALHKLAELHFDLSRIVSATGAAPLPPVAKNDLKAIGRTNDAILYGARVVLFVTGDDASIEAIGPSVPSASSKDHGEPFAAIFARYNNDFYAVDPHLFSPAEIVFNNLDTGRTMRFGATADDVLGRSFFDH
jgi:methenyltetrahydromethanopterin cyclohydrolase